MVKFRDIQSSCTECGEPCTWVPYCREHDHLHQEFNFLVWLLLREANIAYGSPAMTRARLRYCRESGIEPYTTKEGQA